MAKLKKYQDSGKVSPLTEEQIRELAKKRRKGNIVKAIINPAAFIGEKAGKAIKEGQEAEKVIGDYKPPKKAPSGKGKEIFQKLADRLLGKDSKTTTIIAGAYEPSEEVTTKEVFEETKPEVVEDKKPEVVKDKKQEASVNTTDGVLKDDKGNFADNQGLTDFRKESKQEKQPVSKTQSRLDRNIKEVKKMKLDLDTKPKATLVKKDKSKLAVDGKSKAKTEPKKKKRVYNPRTNKFEFR